MGDPCASAGDIGRAAAKGAGIGAVTGFIGGGVVSGAATVGATGPAVQVTSAMITAPISWGMGIDW